MTRDAKVVIAVVILAVGTGGIFWAFDYSDRQLEHSRATMRSLQFEHLRLVAQANDLTPRQSRLIKQMSDTAVLNHDRVLDSLLALANDDRLDSAYRRKHRR